MFAYNGRFYLAELTNISNPLSYQVAEVGGDTMSFRRITPVKGSSRRVPIDVIGKPQAFTASMCFVALKPISALFIRESIGFAIYPKLKYNVFLLLVRLHSFRVSECVLSYFTSIFDLFLKYSPSEQST